MIQPTDQRSSLKDSTRRMEKEFKTNVLKKASEREHEILKTEAELVKTRLAAKNEPEPGG